MNLRPLTWLPLSLLVASCGGGGDSFDRNAMLASLGTVVMVPGYATLQDQTTALDAAADAFCDAPSDVTLSAA